MFLIQSFLIILVIECILVASTIIGYYLFLKQEQDQVIQLDKALLSLGLGLALLSYLIFGLMSIQIFNLMALTSLFGIWLAAGGFLVWQFRVALVATLEELLPKGNKSWWVAGLLIVVILLNLLPALMPSVDWDGVAYHLALPKIYLQHGGFVFRPDIFHNLFPQFMEMLYSLGLFTPYGQAAKVLHFELGLLSAFGVFVAAKKMNTSNWLAALAMLVFYFQYIVHIESGTSFVELGTTFYFLLAIIALLNIKQNTSNHNWAFWAIFCFGITAAIKWHGLIILTLGWLAVLVTLSMNHSLTWKKLILKSIGLGLIGLLPVLPYLIRNILFTGNPIWPLGYSLFGGPFWDSQFASRLSLAVQNYAGTGTTWLELLKLPWNLIVNGKAFSVGAHEFKWPLIGSISLILILISHYYHIFRDKFKPTSMGWTMIMLLFGLIYIVLWFKSSPQFRFLLPLLPLWAILTVKALAKIWQSNINYLKPVVMIIAMMLIAFHPPIHRNSPEQVNVLLGLKSPDDYCAHYLKHYKACQFLNRFMGPSEKVLLFGENRGYYLQGQYIWGDPLLQKVIPYRDLNSPSDLANELITKNITWVLYRNDLYDHDYYPVEIRQLMENFLDRFGEMVFIVNDVKVFKLNYQLVAGL